MNKRLMSGKLAIGGLPATLITIALMVCWHISAGVTVIPVADVLDAFLNFDETQFSHVVVWKLRLPRAVLAILVGAGLAVAGALMQGITRNPLADPGIFGLLAGASFAVVVGVSFFGLIQTQWIPLLAALGALGAAALVWLIASAVPGGMTPLTLVLSGSAISAFLAALITAIQLLDEETFERLRVWLTGGLAGRSLDDVVWAMPWLIVGLVMAFGVARQITALAMGEETAAGLGVNVARIKLIAMTAIIALTASAVAMAGPMGFIGLVIPHAVRIFFGADYRLIVPYCAGFGAIYLLFVDIISRTIIAPTEITTGIVTALVGAPCFVWLVRARL